MACLDITPIKDDLPHADLVAVGLWTDITARILKLPDFSSVHVENLGGGVCSYFILPILILCKSH